MARDGEPLTPLQEAAAALHEMYVAFRDSGFSRTEATTIIAKTTAELITRAADDDTENGNGGGA